MDQFPVVVPFLRKWQTRRKRRKPDKRGKREDEQQGEQSDHQEDKPIAQGKKRHRERGRILKKSAGRISHAETDRIRARGREGMFDLAAIRTDSVAEIPGKAVAGQVRGQGCKRKTVPIAARKAEYGPRGNGGFL